MQLRKLQQLQSAADARSQIIADIIRDSAEKLNGYQRTERQLTEMAEMGETAESRQYALLSLQQNDISLRIEAEKMANLELRQRSVQAEFAAFKAGQELVELQLKSIEGHTRFGQPELDEILSRIADERTRALEKLSAPGGDVRESDARTAWLAEFLDTEETFWKTRHKA